VPMSPRKAWKKIRLHFSVTKMGSHGTFMVCWRACCCAELALFMLILLHATLTNVVIKVSRVHFN